jgi:hypothetical protein
MRVFYAALLALAVAGCGGGGGDDRLTKDELISQANAICLDYGRKVKALDDPRTLTDLSVYAKSAHQALADGLAQLRKLHPPDELQTRYETWVAAGDRALERIDELQKAADKGDQAEIGRLVNAAQREDARNDRMAQQLGMTDCAND